MSKKFKKIGLPMIVIIIVFLIFLNCFFIIKEFIYFQAIQLNKCINSI